MKQTKGKLFLNEIANKKSLHYIMIAFVCTLFIIPFFFAKNVSSNDVIHRNWNVPIFYFIMAILSILILILYCLLFKKKYFWLLLTIISVCICIIGYLALSLSSSLNEALLANKIAYFGNVFLPFFMLVTIADACRYRYTKFSIIILLLISCIMYVFVSTSGYLDIFYKSVEFEMVNGISHLKKSYGITHTFYLCYVFIYFLFMISIIFYSQFKGKLISKKHIILLLLVVFINIFLWLFEKFIYIPIEILSFSYVTTSILAIYLYKQLNSFGLLENLNVSLNFPNELEEIKEIDLETDDSTDEILIEDNLANYSNDKLKQMLNNLNIDTPLTEREIEISILMIKNIKRKKIAEFLFVTEHTVKFHVSNIFKKTNVTNRNELASLIKNQNS